MNQKAVAIMPAENTQGRLLQALEEIDDAVIAFDVEGTILSWNRGAERLFGVKRAKALGSSLDRFFRRQKDAQDFERLKGELFDRDRPVSGELVVRGKDGSPAVTLVIARALPHLIEKPLEAVAIFKDVSHFKEVWVGGIRRAKAHIEERLRRQTRKLRDLDRAYRDLLGHAPNLIFTLDRKGRFLYGNRKVTQATGYAPRELQGRHYTWIVQKEDRHRATRMFQRIFRGRAVTGEIFHIRHKGKGWVPIELDATHILSGDRIKGVLGIAKDVSERVRLQKRLEQSRHRGEHLLERLKTAYRQLKETQAEMIEREQALATGELAAGVAHEIRNPLSIISMSVQYLQSKFPVKDPRREFTEAIVRKVEHLDAITKRLLSFGRRRELNLRRRDLHACLNRVISLFKVKCKAQGVELIKRYRKRLPRILLDEEAIDEVFSNLVANALEAMRRGGRIEVRTMYDIPSKEAVVRITDTGPGIPVKFRRHLFQPFFSTKKERGGSGLGLAISNRLLSEHGGTISVDSRLSGPRHGTTFTVKLPISGSSNLRQGVRRPR